MNTLDKARQLISTLAIAVGLRDSEEYQEAIQLHEQWEMNQKWDELPDKYHNEWKSLIDDWYEL